MDVENDTVEGKRRAGDFVDVDVEARTESEMFQARTTMMVTRESINSCPSPLHPTSVLSSR